MGSPANTLTCENEATFSPPAPALPAEVPRIPRLNSCPHCGRELALSGPDAPAAVRLLAVLIGAALFGAALAYGTPLLLKLAAWALP